MRLKILLIFFILVILLQFIGGVFAETSQQGTYETQPIENPSKEIVLDNKPQMNNGPNLDFGLPFSSFANPEYVAQQKFMEGMTAVYMWIYSNSNDFITKCEKNKEELVSKVVSIVNGAEETSDICKKFESQVQSCNPELFCKNFQKGNLPLPPDAKIILKKMGKDPNKLTLEDLTEDLMMDLCKAQFNKEIENKKAYAEKVKTSIKSQLTNFRSKCEELKKFKDNMGPEIKLPDFYIPKMPEKTQEMTEQKYIEEWQDTKQVETPEKDKKEWKEPPQDETNQQGEIIEEPPQIPSEKIVEIIPVSDTEQDNEPEPVEPEQSNEPKPVEPEQKESDAEPTSAEAAGTTVQQNSTGLFGLTSTYATQKAVCGNNTCEPDLGENPENCHDDCMKNDFYNSSVIGPQQGDMGGGPQGPMGNSEMICELTDDEIIEMYLPQEMVNIEDREEMADYKCKMESSNMAGNINMMKLENAKCLANAALDCASKQKMVDNCITFKSNPKTVAKFMVNNLCRQFGLKPTDHALYDLADKWLSIDPALAYEFGDTVDNTIEEQENLGFFSYIFGNNDYAEKMQEKADKLNAIKQRIIDRNINDPETINVLEEQTKKLDNEADKFGNFFNLSRIFG